MEYHPCIIWRATQEALCPAAEWQVGRRPKVRPGIFSGGAPLISSLTAGADNSLLELQINDMFQI